MSPRLYPSRNEAVEREVLEPLAEDLDALPGDAPDGVVRLCYDVDAIADEVLSTAPDLFCRIVERHALDLPRCTAAPVTSVPCLARVSAGSRRVVVLGEGASLAGLGRG